MLFFEGDLCDYQCEFGINDDFLVGGLFVVGVEVGEGFG